MRLFVQIFLLVALSAMIAVTAMAGLTSLSLSRGFDAYLDDRDDQRLDEFVTEAEAMVRANPQDGIRQVIALIPDPRPNSPPRPNRAERPPQMGSAPTRSRPAPSYGSRPMPPPGFLPRLSLYNVGGERLVGPPLRSEMSGAIHRPIMFQGQMVGEVVLLPRGRAPEGIETDFLRDQFIGIALLVIVIIALAAIAAFFIARRGAMVLADIENVASNVAGGDFSKRAKVNGRGEIAALGQNINRMTQTLGDLQEARRTWLAEVGHELRTPLTVLRGELEALRDGIRPLTLDAIASLDEEANRLSLLVDDLQFMALSDMTRPSFSFAPFPISELLNGAERRFSAQCKAAGHTLTIHNTAPSPTEVHWDNARMDQLLANLISNASAYTDAPGTIRVSAMLKGNEVDLTVEDSAPGVANDNLGRLFDPLFRAEKSRARNLGGSGLGLAVCSVIVEEHGGKISAEPSDLGGLKVSATIPLLNKRGDSSDREQV